MDHYVILNEKHVVQYNNINAWKNNGKKYTNS